jgi:hypothetical protein
VAFREKFNAFNQRVARVLLAILSPILLTLLWIVLGLSCVIPRLLGTQYLHPFRRGGETHWLEPDPPDMTPRGLRRQG